MAINSVDHLYKGNNNYFTVSTTGAEKITNTYGAGGIWQVTVSGFAATPTVIKDFPCDFKIVEASFLSGSFGKAAHAVSLYNGGTTISSTPISNCVASKFIATFALTASRTVGYPSVLNFNVVNVSKHYKLYMQASGASYADMNGTLTLRVRPI